MATEEPRFPHFKRFRPGDATPWAVMHVVDRVVGRQRLLGPEEKDLLGRMVRQISAFTGLEVITWACLDNHYHLLLRVPNAAEAARLRAGVSDTALLEERMPQAFSEIFVTETKRRLEKAHREGDTVQAEDILRRLRNQMFDISAYMHMLKRRFSASYNRQHDRQGTLWEGRFRSVLVEDSPEVLLKIAAYIDLNAVRAGLVEDPKDYRWCGYGEAAAGREEARRGLGRLVADLTGAGEEEARPAEGPGWKEVGAIYRGWLHEAGAEVRDASGTRVVRRGLSQAQVEAVKARRGRLSFGELLQCRVRYFVDGVAIGSRAYVESVFENHRHGFGEKRATGARPLRWGEWGGLCCLRDLQREVIRGRK